MATFAYVGRTRSGAVKKGELSAKTRDEAVDQLRKQSVVVTSLEEKKSGAGGFNVNISFGSGLTDKDLVVFTRQFGTMINAGLPLVQCLEILSTQSENKVLRETIGEVKTQVEAGSTFSDALRRHPKVFDDLYVNLVHAGEVGGLLDTILTRLAKYIEKAMKLKGQIKSAMIYPAAILGVAVVVIAVLMIWVIPIFAKMFNELSGGKMGLAGSYAVGYRYQQYFYVVLVRDVWEHCGGHLWHQEILFDLPGTNGYRQVPSQDASVWGPDQEGFGRQVYTDTWNVTRERSPASGRDDYLRKDCGQQGN